MDGQGLGDNGRGDEGRFDDLPPVDVVVPDDASELDDDARAVHRELRRQRRRAAMVRIFQTKRWRRFGLSGPLIVVVLLVVGLVASTLGVLRPRQPAVRPVALPLAESADVVPGEVGGLLPAAQVTVDGASRSSRDLRPAVLILVSPDCGCEQQLDTVFRQVQEYGLAMYLTGDGVGATEIIDIARRIGNGTASPVVDESGALRTAYGGAGLTAVLVHADGIVSAAHRDLPVEARLEPELAHLTSPGAR